MDEELREYLDEKTKEIKMQTYISLLGVLSLILLTYICIMIAIGPA